MLNGGYSRMRGCSVLLFLLFVSEVVAGCVLSPQTGALSRAESLPVYFVQIQEGEYDFRRLEIRLPSDLRDLVICPSSYDQVILYLKHRAASATNPIWKSRRVTQRELTDRAVRLAVGHNIPTCHPIQLKLRIVSRRDPKDSLSLPLADVRTGPRGYLRQLRTLNVTQNSAEITWSDDANCTDSFRIRSQWGALQVDAVHRKHKLGFLEPASSYSLQVAPCFNGFCGHSLTTNFSTFPDQTAIEAWLDSPMQTLKVNLNHTQSYTVSVQLTQNENQTWIKKDMDEYEDFLNIKLILGKCANISLGLEVLLSQRSTQSTMEYRVLRETVFTDKNGRISGQPCIPSKADSSPHVHYQEAEDTDLHLSVILAVVTLACVSSMAMVVTVMILCRGFCTKHKKRRVLVSSLTLREPPYEKLEFVSGRSTSSSSRHHKRPHLLLSARDLLETRL